MGKMEKESNWRIKERSGFDATGRKIHIYDENPGSTFNWGTGRTHNYQYAGNFIL